MVKESNYGIRKEPIFRETFNDFNSIAKRGGSATDLSLSYGKGTFDGSSTNIDYGNINNFKSNFSIRLKLDIQDVSSAP